MPQVYAQFRYFLVDPIKNDVKYQASAQPFLVSAQNRRALIRQGSGEQTCTAAQAKC